MSVGEEFVLQAISMGGESSSTSTKIELELVYI